MSCCGQRRAMVRETPAVARAATAPPPAIPAPGTRWLRYVGAASVIVRGPVTRREYTFAGALAVLRVDVRDADQLLRTGLFRASG